MNSWLISHKSLLWFSAVCPLLGPIFVHNLHSSLTARLVDSICLQPVFWHTEMFLKQSLLLAARLMCNFPPTPMQWPKWTVPYTRHTGPLGKQMSHAELSWPPIKDTSWPGVCPLQGEAQRAWVLSKHMESWLMPLLSQQMGITPRWSQAEFWHSCQQ